MERSEIEVWLVDDEPFMLKLLSRMLERLGYARLERFEDPRQALARLPGGPGQGPDLVLLDINMPGLDGVEFVRHLGEAGYRGGLVLVSGEDPILLQATERLARAHGLAFLGALSKPISPERLQGLLGGWSPRPALLVEGRPSRDYTLQELLHGVERGQLVNYYQPKVDLRTGRLVGAEALVRWAHPQDGLLQPYLFIPMAESSGAVWEVTRRVLLEALTQAHGWLEGGLLTSLSVNVSMADLPAPDFLEFVVATTTGAGIDPRTVILELTESSLLQRLTTVLEVLTRLKLKRFRLSIDDFGTGHSSLAQLRDLPFDELKIDRGFTHRAWADGRLRAIFEGSLSLARQLGMKAVAEGVEDRADWDFLRASRCDLAQGYFVARPMSAEVFPAWAQEWARRVEQEGLLEAPEGIENNP